jgi:hypothetical protein
MAIASNPGPFDGVPSGDVNRIRRITFMVGPTKTVAHVDNRGSGGKAGYEKARDDSQDPGNIHVVKRDRYIDEES